MKSLILGLLCLGHSITAGANLRALRVEPGGLAKVLYFITDDCPMSNGYAPEMARICSVYGTKGISCALVYVNPSLTDEQARHHAQEYAHGDYPKIVDHRHELVKATGVKNTPEVAVMNKSGKVVYRGRIDDSVAALAQPKRPVKNAYLRNALDDIVAGRPVAKPKTKAIGCYISDLAVLISP